MNLLTTRAKYYSTHNPILIKAVLSTRGTVLELGSGPFSTPLLHWLCAEKKRPLYTFESNPEYFSFSKAFQSGNHHVRHIADWNDLGIKELCSVALIDQHKDRGATALQLKDKVELIILHDSEAEELYGYDKIWGEFKYRYDWKASYPWTTVVSNFIDITNGI